MRSPPPPAAKPHITVMLRLGKFCAPASRAGAMRIAIAAATARQALRMIRFSPRVLLRRDLRDFDVLLPLRVLVAEELVEVQARGRERVDAGIVEELLGLIAQHDLVDPALQLRNDRCRHAGRRKYAPPARHVESGEARFS